jgi:cell division protein FtsI (penicillin-binding protein 3)
MIDRRYTWRVLITTVVFLGVWAGLSARLAFLHLGPNERLRQKVAKLRYHEEKLLGRRGRILDANRSVLALDLTVKHVIADPAVIQGNRQVDLIGQYLVRILQLPPAAVFGRLERPNRRYEPIEKNVSVEVADRLERMQFQGIRFEVGGLRHYPLGSSLCHVVGFSNHEGVGSAGVELAMDKYLRPRAGLRVSQRDARGRELYVQRSLDIEPEDGADVWLTVDQRVQYVVERALEAAMERHQARGAWAIVQRVKTGEILAMAAKPDFDVNQFARTPYEQMLNRAIGYSFEPGSTLKAAIIAGALNEGVVGEDDVIDCENGMWMYGGRPLRDYHPHGRLTVADVIKESSNIGAAKIALKMGDKKVEQYLRSFGFGVRAGLELPGEEAGILSRSSSWSPISITRLAMGHEIAVTSLQMLNMICAIANDGFLMRPYIVRAVIDARGHHIVNTQPEVVGRPIRETTARQMMRLLTRVTEEGGTGTRARMEGFTIAGKTGTAQKPVPGGYSSTANMASFVGFLPAERPEIGIIVVVDEPQPLRTGGQVAAPVFRDIAEQTVRCLDIPPLTPVSALAARANPAAPAGGF